MRNRQKKEPTPELKDPRLEFARLTSNQGEFRQPKDPRQPFQPPAAIDSDFCFSEDGKQ